MGKQVVKSEFDPGSSMLLELPLVVATTPKDAETETETSTSAEGGRSPILEKPIGD